MTVAEQYFGREDGKRLETKVDVMAKELTDIRDDVRSIRESIDHREALERQERVLKAEIEAREKALKDEKAANEKGWTELKTKALWILLGICLVGTYPNIAYALKVMKGLIP